MQVFSLLAQILHFQLFLALNMSYANDNEHSNSLKTLSTWEENIH